MNPTFQGRMLTAREHELAVRARLEAAGWLVDWFGQAQIPEAMRKVIRTCPTALRWLPDMIATREGPAGNDIVFVDAKTGRDDTPNYCVEIESVKALAKFEEFTSIKCLYVMCDFKVLDTQTIVKYGRKVDDGYNAGAGSGTPYYLIAKVHAKVTTFGAQG